MSRDQIVAWLLANHYHRVCDVDEIADLILAGTDTYTVLARLHPEYRQVYETRRWLDEVARTALEAA